MSRFKGTPGKWSADISDNGAYEITGSDNGAMLIICSRRKWESRKEMSCANARAIAQVPEMIAALEAISVMVAASKSSSYEARLTAALDMLDWARLTASAALDAATKEETE